MKTLVGMSGGVDSAVTAALISKNADAAGITLQLYDGGNADMIEKFNREASDAADVCKKLGIPHTVLDLKDEFNDFVIKYFIDEYIKGRTPNPCIQCNINIKFGAMLEFAEKNGFDKIATGHYAETGYENGRYFIKKSSCLSHVSKSLFDRTSSFNCSIFSSTLVISLWRYSLFLLVEESSLEDSCSYTSIMEMAFVADSINFVPVAIIS